VYQIGTTLIVGASPDLVELAKILGKDGEQIGLMARTESRLQQFKQRLNAGNVTCEAFAVDVTEAGSVLIAFQKFAQWSPRLDRLIYNVGMQSQESARSLTTSSIHKVMSTNFFGFVNCLQLAMPMFKRTGGGHIITISSVRSLDEEQPVAYAASKASLRIYTSALRRDIQETAIKISELYLGQIPQGQESRDLNCEEIVGALLTVIEQKPERFMVGQSHSLN
jgi:short-subunit dehydrogenase